MCTVRRAAVLVLKSRAEVLEKGDGRPALGAARARSPVRDPPDPLRPHPTRRTSAQDHPQGGPRARFLHVPVLRPRGRRADGRPRDPAQPRRALGGRTSWPRAPRATAGRETGCRARRACTRRDGRRRRAHRLHPDRRAPGYPWPGSRTWSPPTLPDWPVSEGPPEGAALPRCDFGRVSDSRPGGTAPGLRYPSVPGVGLRQAARTLLARADGRPPDGRGGRLAAPHLQRPEEQVTQLRTTSFLW